MNDEKKLIEQSVSAFRANTGLRGKYKKGETADYDLEIIVSGGQTLRYAAQVKKNFSNSKLGDALLEARRFAAPPVLITEYVTQPQAEKMRSLGVQFLDAAGNAFLSSAFFFVFITGKKAAFGKAKPLSIFRPAGMKLIFACLQKSGFENADYRTIAAETGTTHTTVGRVFSDLEEAGYLIKRGGERRLIKKAELIKRWAISYGEQFRATLKPRKYSSAKQKGTSWWKEIDIGEYEAVWGGEIGGAVLTKHLKPQTATVYAASNLPKLQAKYGLIRDEKGEIEILRKFWTFGEIGDAAPPLVVYADLLATADERNLETAREIYDRYLAQIAEENS